MYQADPAEILSAIRAIAADDQIIELRALQVPGSEGFRRTVSGFFDNLELFTKKRRNCPTQEPKASISPPTRSNSTRKWPL